MKFYNDEIFIEINYCGDIFKMAVKVIPNEKEYNKLLKAYKELVIKFEEQVRINKLLIEVLEAHGIKFEPLKKIEPKK